MKNPTNAKHSINSVDILKSTKIVLEKRSTKQDSSNTATSKVLSKIRKGKINFCIVSFKTSCLRSLLKFQKSFAYIGCFGLFTKVRRHMGLIFSANFLHTFFIKMFLITNDQALLFEDCGLNG